MAKKKDENPIKPQPAANAGTQPIGGQMGGELGSNLQLGGFGNPMGFTPPQPRSMFESSAEQFSRLPEQTARPSDLFSTAVPAFPAQLAQPMGRSAMDLRSTPSMAPTTDAITAFGEPSKSTTIRISNQYGTGSTTLTPDQVNQRSQARQQAQQLGTMPRTPEQQQELLAKMRTLGADIGKRLAGEEKDRQTGLQRKYYSFRQGLEQDRFQSAMSQAEKSLARGESGRDAIRMANQAAYGGEIMRQAGANVGTSNRTPFFSWERASMPSGEKFYRGSMGEYSRVVRDLAARGGSPQPMTAAPQFGRANTTQRSWDNYVGPNPIKSFRYSGGD